MKEAEKLLGRRLDKSEISLFNLMNDDNRYEMYKNDRGGLAYRLKS